MGLGWLSRDDELGGTSRSRSISLFDWADASKDAILGGCGRGEMVCPDESVLSDPPPR